jgi:hypothetical protein
MFLRYKVDAIALCNTPKDYIFYSVNIMPFLKSHIPVYKMDMVYATA